MCRGKRIRNAWRHTLVYGKYRRSSGPGFTMASIFAGAVSLPWSSMRRTIHALVGRLRSVQRQLVP